MTRPIIERPIGWNANRAEAPAPRGADEPGDLDLGKVLGAVRRQLPLVLLMAFLGLALAAAAIMGSVPLYTAVETVLLDEERAELLDQVSALPNSVRNETTLQSEEEIIRSQALALQVVDQLDLAEDEAFLNPPTAATQQVERWLRGLADPFLDLISPPDPPATPLDPSLRAPSGEPLESAAPDSDAVRAARILQGGLDVRRVGRSFVFEIAYTGYDPVQAARIAQAYGEVYTRFQLEAMAEVARNASEWLEERLETLQQQSVDASRAVQQFRQENNLVAVRDNLLADQQLSEMTSQLIEAEAATAQAKARLDSFQALLDEGPSRASAAATLVTGTLSDELLSSLRADYITTRREWREVVNRYSEAHPDALRLESTLRDIEQAISDELQRAAAGLRAGYEVALTREEALRSALEATSGESGSSSALLGRLRQLEAISDTYAAVYRDYLQRYELTAQQQDFPIAAVKVISHAEVPRAASSPQKKTLLAMGLFLGGLAGAGLGAFREMREHPLRTREEVSEQLAIACAGLVPSGARFQPGKRPSRRDAVLERTLYKIRSAIDARRPGVAGVIVGIASVSPDEASLKVMPDLLRLLSLRKDRAIVLDARPAHARNSVSSTRAELRQHHASGLADLDLMQLANPLREAGSDAELLPRELSQLFSKLRQDYDYSLVILPPLTDAVVAEALSRALDATVLLVPWGKVPARLVRGALDENPEFTMRLATSALLGADLRVARRYLRRGGYEDTVMSGN